MSWGIFQLQVERIGKERTATVVGTSNISGRTPSECLETVGCV